MADAPPVCYFENNLVSQAENSGFK